MEETSYQGITLQGSFLNFIAEFGWVLLYTDSRDVPLLSIYPLSPHRARTLADGNAYIEFGFRGSKSFFFSETLILAGQLSPVFESTARQVKMINISFEDWFKESGIWAKSQFSKRKWSEIINGYKPFSKKEIEIVVARTKFIWQHIGFADNGDAIFSVRNESNMWLPYISIGVRGVGGSKLVGGAWLNVSNIAPGERDLIHHDCYKNQLHPSELEVFALDDPIPEKKERYWEFKAIANLAKE